jgi:hypothetical protein
MNRLHQTINHHQNGVLDLENGRYVIKSMEIKYGGDARIGNDQRNPRG